MHLINFTQNLDLVLGFDCPTHHIWELLCWKIMVGKCHQRFGNLHPHPPIFGRDLPEKKTVFFTPSLMQPLMAQRSPFLMKSLCSIRKNLYRNQLHPQLSTSTLRRQTKVNIAKVLVSNGWLALFSLFVCLFVCLSPWWHLHLWIYYE